MASSHHDHHDHRNQNHDHPSQQHYHHVHPTHDVAADALFLESTPVLELHRSNVLRLETLELLKECRLDVQHVSWHAAAHDYIASLNQVLTKLPDQVDCKDEKCPFPLEADKPPTLTLSRDAPLHVAWHPASQVGITTRAGNAKELPLLDCTIALPNDLWSPKDYLNHRYFHKRNLILWHIIQHLNKHLKTVGTVQWRFANGNDRFPCILLTPPTSSGHKKKRKKTTSPSLPRKNKFQVQISLRMESSDWIPPTRLFPNRCNLRNVKESGTPVYNHDLVACANEETAALLLHSEILPPSLQDALVLIKVWCLQRGFLDGHDSFDIKRVAFLLVYLLRTKHVTARMAPLEILTVWFKFMAETQWLENDNDSKHKAALVVPLEDCTEAQTIQQCQQAQLYAQHTKDSPMSDNDPPTLLDCFRVCTDGPVLLNSSMTLNLWGRLSPSFIRAVQASAKASLDCMHSTTMARPFGFLFLKEARFWSAMDAVMRIPIKALLLKSNFDTEDAGSFDGVARALVRILHRALGDRVHLIRILTTGNGRLDSASPSQIPTYHTNDSTHQIMQSPVGDEDLVLGFTLNPETCHRVVDRGPPADNAEATRSFLELWGSKAQLRRFKDGAIVHAVVWNTPEASDHLRMEGDDKSQGGIVERIVCHILDQHFMQHEKKQATKPQFALRNILSLVDGVVASSSISTEEKLLCSSTAAHKSVMSAFTSLSEFLRQHSTPTIPVPGSADAKTCRLGVPLAIDAVEPLSPSLRYSELFPPVPHPSLGGPKGGSKKVSGVAPSPVLIQIRFGASSKWPSDLKAMGAAKTAMLIQLADGIETMKMQCRDADGFEGPIQVTSGYMDIGYKGYSWRILVRADPELHMLRKLQKPTPEAASLLRMLTREHVVSAMHHSTIHAIHTLHPSSGSVVRLAKRWTACHLLSDLIPFEAIELLVAKVYTNRDIPMYPPSTVVSGFLRFLHLLASHDWTRHPLVVDPQGHISEDDHSAIESEFEHARGSEFLNGPPMYIISPNDRQGGAKDEDEEATTDSPRSTWSPTFTQHNPERVVLSRAAALAKRSYDFLMNSLTNNDDVDWSVVFHESASSFKSYSALLRVDPDFITDNECSSTGSDIDVRASSDGVLESSFTRSMRQRSLGPKALRRKVYRNLNEEDFVLHGWTPIEELVQTLRDKFGSLALFFYNDLAPEVIGVLWRPTSFVPQPLSVMHSEYVRPVEEADWKSDSLVVHNTNDILREMSQYTESMVVNVKVLDDRSVQARPKSKKRSASESEDSSSDSE